MALFPENNAWSNAYRQPRRDPVEELTEAFEREAREKSAKGNGHAPATPFGARWLDACQTDRSANPLPNLYNAVLALRNDPVWHGGLRFDEMRYAAVMRDSGAPVVDLDVFRIKHWMQANGLERMATESVREAVEIVAQDDAFHPLRDWLARLTWDGNPRLATWLNRCLGTRDDNYHASIGFWFLLSMVARVMRPGCKCDYMLVLEGPQGIMKSQAAAVLAGDYFSDSLPELGGDPIRVSMHLRGKWVIEVSELSAFSRAEASRLKAFLTSPIEEYTPKHGRKEVREPRQCVFIGTTNSNAYLRDDTGGRRFWPVKCGIIDLELLRADREQLLAEAVAAFRDGKPWWPDAKFETVVIQPVQETRHEGDAWDEQVLAYLIGRGRVTVYEIATESLEFSPSHIKKPDELRITAILRRAGWTSHRTTNARFWLAP